MSIESPAARKTPSRDETMQAMRMAAREAVEMHKKLGIPIVVHENGKVVEIPPAQIDVDDIHVDSTD